MSIVILVSFSLCLIIETIWRHQVAIRNPRLLRTRMTKEGVIATRLVSARNDISVYLQLYYYKIKKPRENLGA